MSRRQPLDGDSNMPMAILRDPVTGRVRGLHGVGDPVAMQAADARAQGAGSPNVLFSCGIPGRGGVAELSRVPDPPSRNEVPL